MNSVVQRFMLALAFSMPYEKKEKGERKTSEAGRERSRRKLSNGSRLTSQYSVDERATLRRKKKKENSKGERERDMEMQESVIEELLTVDSIPLFRRGD